MDSRRIKTVLVVVFSVFAVTTLLAMAQPTATNLYVEDANGYKNTTISLPVNIVDTQNGVAGIEFELVYNKSVLNLTQIRKGDLFDDSSSMLDKKGEQGDYTILVTGYSLTDGSNGSIVVCDFSITGEPGETSLVNLSNINLYNKMGETGTASANNGTFTITAPSQCFIATAAYGTPLHEDIDVLRDFRDEYLMTNPIGRAFVKMYYTTSPPVADVISENEYLRMIVREGLVKHLVYISRLFVG